MHFVRVFKVLLHTYANTSATIIAEVRPRRPFSAEIPEESLVNGGLDGAPSILNVVEQLSDVIESMSVLAVVVIVNPLPVNVLPDKVPLYVCI